MKEIPQSVLAAFLKFREGEADEADMNIIHAWEASCEQTPLSETEEAHIPQVVISLFDKLVAIIDSKEEAPDKPARGKVVPMWVRAVAAACVLGLAGIAFFVFSGNKKQAQQPALSAIHDIPPGGRNAILTLSDGKVIDLTQAANGKIAAEGAAAITMNENGHINYSLDTKVLNGATGSSEPLINTLSVPTGGGFTLTLSDGSKVWLNAASTLRFPTFFSGKERGVELLKGEAYFEVAANSKQAFQVLVPAGGSEKVQVQVLGTSFNINAYNPEKAVTTTLVSGKVRVNALNNTSIIASSELRPDYEAVFANGKTAVNPADTELAIAWKNGRFEFNSSIEDIMEYVKRWYKVEVEYKGPIQDRFITSMPMDKPLSQLLHQLQATEKVHFEIVGNKVIVSP